MSEHFGTLPDGREVRRYRLRTPSGGELRLLDLGAAVQGYRLDAGDPGSEVIVGFDDLDDVLAVRKAYFGAVVGRYANRLAAARITVDGREYTLSANEGATCLHGGAEGFDSRVWRVVEESADAVAFELASPDGDQGFPGELTARARYGVQDGGFALELSAVTQAPTVALLTAHVYANLDQDGAGTIDDQVLTVDADAYVPVDADLIPTGELATVAGTPFDLRGGEPIGRQVAKPHPQTALTGGGIDHSFDIAGSGLRRHARLEDPRTGRSLELWSDQPGLQVFTGNFGDGSPRLAGGGRLARGLGLALEPQQHPDAPHQSWSTDAILRPGETWTSRIEWRFARGQTP